MNAIKATWIDGKILPAGPVDWPEGSQLVVEPVGQPSEPMGLDESQWSDDPTSLADWESWMRTIEPPVLSEEEEARIARFREEQRQHNLEAVARQMRAGNAP